MQERFPWLYLWRKVTIIKYAWNVRARGWQCDRPHHVQLCDCELASPMKSVQEIFSGRSLFAIIVCTRISPTPKNDIILIVKKVTLLYASIVFHGPLWARTYEENYFSKMTSNVENEMKRKISTLPQQRNPGKLGGAKKERLFRSK